MARSSRAFIHATLVDMWPEAGRIGEFQYDLDVRLRLATTWAIDQARDVVAAIYGPAGATAIFNETPFEHGRRDIHSGTRQGQGPPNSFRSQISAGAAAGGPHVPVSRYRTI